MQIIPLCNRQIDRENSNLTIDTYSSYSNSIGFPVSLKERNSHLLVGQEQILSSNTQLSFEEILRLKNTLKEKKVQTQEEEDALRELLEQGGSHSVQAIIEQIAYGMCGIQGLTPEEYTSLQQFLQDIGFNVEEIDSLTDQMMTQSGAVSSITSILLQSKEYVQHSLGEEELYNIIPILRKISIGKYGNVKGELTSNNLVSELEHLLEDIQSITEQRTEHIENLSAFFTEEMQAILNRREQKNQALNNASTQTSTVVSAEELRFSRSATEEGISKIIQGSEQQESSFSEYTQEGEQGASSESESNLMQSRENMKFLFGNQVVVSGQSINTRGESISSSSRLLETQKAYILDTVQQSFISLQKDNSAQITLQLNPQELGNLQLQLQYYDGKMQAILRPEQSDVYHLLKEHSTYIMQSLQDQGVNIDAITVVENKGEWLQYQSSRENFSQSGDNNFQEKSFSQEQERRGRIRYFLDQIIRSNPSNVGKATRLLEVIA